MKTRKIINTIPAWPLISFMTVVVGCPLIYVLVLSFLSRAEQGGIAFKLTFDNYLRIFDPIYFKIFAVSIGIAAITCVLTLLIGYPFAYYVAMLNKKIRFYVVYLIMVPFWTSSLLRVYGIIILLRNDGIINKIAMVLNILNEPVTLLYNYGAVMVGTVYILLPLMILPIYNSVEKLDRSYLEASRDLGASRIKTFVNITLPLTMPGIVGGVTLVFIPAVGFFFISDLMGGAKTMLIGNLVRNQMTTARDWPFGAALSVVMMLLVLIFIYVYFKTTKSNGEVGGGLF